MAALGNIKAPLDYRDTWQRACDDITDQDLEGSDDADTSAELLRKRPDALADGDGDGDEEGDGDGDSLADEEGDGKK